MTSCDRTGECLIQCECECYNEETYEQNEICSCGHREHNGYCPSYCCLPIECRNYKYCKEIQPQWVSNCHNGMCMNCAVQLGRHKTTNTLDDCPVCLENKNMLILKCNHKVCNDCWFTITKKGFGNEDVDEYKPLCPLCRSLNDWSK
jgi:hypothetical protein